MINGAWDIVGLIVDVQRPSTFEEPIPRSLRAHVWCWMLRLILPMLVVLLGLVLYWLWFDSPVDTDWWGVAGGLPLFIGGALILIWSVSSWFRSYPI
jgi:peptidoglycan/LPS O-acetylase OafA/YrhL